MSKFISTSNLSKLSKALDKRCIDLINEEKERAMGIEQGLQTSVSNKADANHNHDDRYFTETEMNTKIGEINEAINGHVADLNAAIAGKADTSHNHDDRYFTETEVTTKLAGKADTDHAHDDMYYTETEIDGKITTLNNAIAGKADTGHNHDDRYYTETEINGKIEDINETINTNVSTLNTAIATAKSGAISESKSYTDTAIANLVDSAPEAMNTLNELAKAIGDHQTEYEAYVATVAANIATAKAEAIAEAAKKDTALHTTISAEIDADVKVEKERAMEAENALQAVINGKANASHTHDYLPYNGTLSSGDLNTIKTTGYYSLKGNLYNAPAEGNAFLFVDFTVGTPFQLFMHDATFKFYMRNYALGTWGGWNAILGNDILGNAATADKVKNALSIQLNGGTTTIFDGSTARSINITPSSIGAAASSHTHDDRYYTETEINTKIEDINESINEQVAGLQADISTKADQSYVDEKLETVDAITLNGYSLWVGTTEELEAITERDPNTLYFEIDDGTGGEVVQVDIVNGVLQLTADKYQKTNMLDGTTIVFPTVNRFTEIHLYFTAGSNMNINLPDNCKWRVEPNIEEGNYYEIVAVYNTLFWLVNVISYSDEYSGDTDSNKLIWFDNKEIYSSTGSMETCEGYISSDFISLEEDKDYQITVLNNTDTEIHCYDDEKNYLSDLNVSLTDYGVRVYSLRKMFDMDDMDISNTKYIRIETEKNKYINATNANEKIIIEEIDTLEDNQVPLIIMDDCSINTSGGRGSKSGYITIQYIVLDNYFNYQFEFLGSDTTVNFYDEAEVFISRNIGENDDYFEGQQVVLNSDDFPEGTKSVRIRFMENDTITFENIHEYLKVTKTPVVSENIMPLNWIENTSLDATNGEPKLSDARAITDFIEIDDSYYYTITLDEPNDVKEYYYNSNKEFISRSSYNDISTGNEVLEFPEGTKYIRLKSDTDKYTIDIVKERITLKKFLKKENFLYSFGLLSDVHIDNNHDADYEDTSMSIKDYKNALRFLEDEGANFIAYCGDMTKDHSDSLVNYQLVAECLKESHVPNYIIKGNHDAGTGGFDKYISDITRFTVPYNDDLFIFVGNVPSTSSTGGLNQSRIDYIRSVIEDNPNRRLFLMYHQFIRGYGSGDGTGGLYPHPTIGDDPNNALTNEFIELVTNTPNLIYCHGHSHIRFNVQDTCPTANYYHADGECHDIHVPSCARPRIPNESGGLSSYHEGSEGYIVDVYSDKVIFKAIDFATNRYMPEYNQVVNLAAVAAEYDSIPNPTLYIDTENGSIAADGTIQDISGNNYPITAYNTSILDDEAITFNIDNKSYLECGLDPNDTCWTAEIYFRLTDIIEQDMKIFGWGTSENKFTTNYDWDKYSLDFKYGVDIEKDNFNDYIDYDTNTDFTNKFVHIMYSCDGDSVVININGKTVITCDVTPMTEVAKNIIIGKHYNSDKEYANMELKLFRFYNGVALNRYQMQCNYLNLIRG